ncbi:MAG: Uma2 family endonuclease [Cyclobacteriaceae bacterium]
MNAVSEKIAELRQLPELAIILDRLEKEMREEAQKRNEFYELIHENVKAEFINGAIVYHSPVMRRHWKVSMNVSRELSSYAKKHDLGEEGVEKVMISLTRNDYEPDIVFFSKEKSRLFTPQQMHFPAPDLVVEILSDSTEKNDRNIKFRDYASHGVKEYWIIDADKASLEQYINTDNEFQLSHIFIEGILKAETAKGFELDVRSIFE